MISHIKKRKEIYLLIMLLSLAVFVMFLPSWIKGGYFVGGGDVKTQWYEFYTLFQREMVNSIKNKSFPFYSWVMFLGGDLWSSKASYGMFDIYNIPFYLTSINYFVVYEIQTLLKIVVGGLSCYSFLNKMFGNNKWNFLGAFIYGLSSFAIYFTSQPGFLSFYSLLPLYFLGIENYLRDDKKIVFVLSVFFLLSSNYYLFFSVCFFSPFYFIYRYYNLNGSIKKISRKIWGIIFIFLIGLFLSACFIFPTFLNIIQNERVGMYNTNLFFKDLQLYLHLLINSFVPGQTYIYGNNIFDFGEHTLKELCIFSSSLISISFTQFICHKNSKYKYSTTILYLILILILFTPIGNASIQGFSEVCFRWTPILILFNIITSIECLSRSELNLRVLRITTIIESMLIVICFIFALISKRASFVDYITQAIIFIVSIIFLYFMYLLVKNSSKYILLAVVMELCLYSFISGYKSKSTSITNNNLKEVTSVLAINNDYKNLKAYLDSLNSDNYGQYYRVFIPYESLYWKFSRNMNIIYNIQGLMTYDSTYAQSFNDMRDIDREEIIEAIDWEFNIKDKNIINFLNTKYSITLKEEEIPFSNYTIIDDMYRNGLIVAENNDYRTIGTTYCNYVNKNDYNNNTELLIDTIIGENDEIVDYLKSKETNNLNSIEYYNNYLKGTVISDDDSFMVISLPYEEGWKIRVNGEIVEKYKVNGGNIGLKIFKGENLIEMSYVPEGFKIGTICSVAGVVAFIIIVIKEKRNSK